MGSEGSHTAVTSYFISVVILYTQRVLSKVKENRQKSAEDLLLCHERLKSF